MDDYIALHKQTYDILADEYFERVAKVDSNCRAVGKYLADFSVKKLLESNKKNNYRILELGCGPGAILVSLNDRMDFELFAIDLSENMLAYAQTLCPRLRKINKNVLDIANVLQEFSIDKYFDLIIMASFIHLFPFRDAQRLLTNIKEWLEPNGLIYLDTTDESKFEDGKVTIKEGYKKEVKRLRTRWTKNEFNKLLNNSELEIMEQVPHVDNNNKTWIRTIVRKSVQGDNDE